MILKKDIFKNKQEAYTKFDKDWKDWRINGVVMDVEVQKMTKGSNYTYVAALYEIAHNVTIEKKLSIGLMKSGLASGQEDAAHKPAPGPKCRLGSKGGQLALIREKFVPKRGDDGLTPGERAAHAAKYIDMKKRKKLSPNGNLVTPRDKVATPGSDWTVSWDAPATLPDTSE